MSDSYKVIALSCPSAGKEIAHSGDVKPADYFGGPEAAAALEKRGYLKKVKGDVKPAEKVVVAEPVPVVTEVATPVQEVSAAGAAPVSDLLSAATGAAPSAGAAPVKK